MTTAPAHDETGLTLTPAGAADLPSLAALYVQMSRAHGHQISREDAAAKLAKGLAAGQGAMLFRKDQTLLGMIIWMDCGDHVFVRNFVIDRDHRREGRGSALFQRWRREVTGGREIRLETSALHAQAFWQAQGFAVWSTGLKLDEAAE